MNKVDLHRRTLLSREPAGAEGRQTTRGGGLLRLLRAAQGAVPISEIARELEDTPAFISAELQALAQRGYELRSSGEGIELISTPDILTEDELNSWLWPSILIGSRVQVYRETSSTNDVAEKLAQAGAAEGTVIFAEAQTSGRGRQGRKWISPSSGGLYFSVLLRPKVEIADATRLTIAAAVALAEGIEAETGLSPSIKWPNDLQLGQRKVGGILTELRAQLDRIDYLILGIGLNVNFRMEHLPVELQDSATTLAHECKRKIFRGRLAATILRKLNDRYAEACDGQFAAVSQEWQRRCSTLGKFVQIQSGNRIMSGFAESLDASGALLLRTEHGHLEHVLSGDVKVLAH